MAELTAAHFAADAQTGDHPKERETPEVPGQGAQQYAGKGEYQRHVDELSPAKSPETYFAETSAAAREGHIGIAF